LVKTNSSGGKIYTHIMR